MSPSSVAAGPLRRALLGVVTVAVTAAVITGCQPSFGGSPDRPAQTSTASPALSPALLSSVPVPMTTTTAQTGPSASGSPATATASPSRPASPAATPNQPTTPPTSTRPTTTSASGPAPVGAGRIRPGIVYAGLGTYYGADGRGNCEFDRLSDPAMPVVAMNRLDYENARACGAYIEVTGPGGSTVVKVTDQCPECEAGRLDLSREVFERISGGLPGLPTVTWRLVSPASIGSIQYQVRDGASQYWLAIQVREHRNPIASLEVRVNGSWVALGREEWNYFVAPHGLGPGPFTVRITDVYGQQLVHTVNLAPATIQTTNSQFAQH